MKRPLAMWIIILGLATLAFADTTIVINSSSDATTDPKHTCTYSQGGLFFPPGDGLCTFRRAIVEASARPQSDRPIQIVFDGILPLSGDPNYDPATGVVTFPITAALPPLKTDTILNIDGSVTLQGPPLTADSRPSIMIDTNWSLEIESENNTIRNIGFHGGGGFLVKEAGNTLEHIMLGLREDGLELEPEDSGDPADLAGNGIFISGDDVTIRNSVISGTYGKAIDINSGTNNVLIENNFIGTRHDGTVPWVDPAPYDEVVDDLGAEARDLDPLATHADRVAGGVSADDVVSDVVIRSEDLESSGRRVVGRLGDVEAGDRISCDAVTGAGHGDTPAAVPVGRVEGEGPVSYTHLRAHET